MTDNLPSTACSPKSNFCFVLDYWFILETAFLGRCNHCGAPHLLQYEVYSRGMGPGFSFCYFKSKMTHSRSMMLLSRGVKAPGRSYPVAYWLLLSLKNSCLQSSRQDYASPSQDLKPTNYVCPPGGKQTNKQQQSRHTQKPHPNHSTVFISIILISTSFSHVFLSIL